MKHIVLAVTALAAVAVAAPAFATVEAQTSTYTFSGLCADCVVPGSTATAVLTLTGYTPGAALNDKNFVSFTYNSDKEDFTSGFILATDEISGSISAAEGYYNFSYAQNLFGLFPLTTFNTSTDGTWNYSNHGIDLDHGSNGAWNAGVSAVPEPATWAFMIAGVGFAGGMMRRANRKSEERFTAKVRGIANA